VGVLRRRLRLLALRARRTTYGPVNAAQGVWDDLVAWFNGLGLSENVILIGFAVAIGLGGAGSVILFYKLLDLAHAAFFSWPESVMPELGQLAYRPLLTGLGAVAAWWVMGRFARGYDGLNVPDVQLAVVRRQGDIPTRPAVVRSAASALTIGSGGSAGSEGPVAVLGAALASRLGRAFDFSGHRTGVLVGAGAAAGISAAFNAPLAGAFFALEEILGTSSVGAFAPVVVSSVVAAVVSRGVFGNHPVFPLPVEQGYTLTREVVLFYPLLGLVAGLVSVAFIRCYFGIDQWARGVRRRPARLALAGGALVGGLTYLSGGLLVGSGHVAIPLDRFTGLAWYVLALLALGKIVATSVTLNTGGSGGLFTPSLYVGAATGAAFGAVLLQLAPALHLSAQPYALVGMGSVIAAATNAPMTGILMVFEMTDNSAIMLPLMLSVVVSHAVARRLERDSLYSGWLRRRGEHIQHGQDQDALASLRVADAYDPSPTVIGGDAVATRFLSHLGTVHQEVFPVVAEDSSLLGVLSVEDLMRIARHDSQDQSRLVACVAARPSETLAAEDSLLEAVRRMGVRGVAALPVVDRATGRLRGLLTQSDVGGLYGRLLAGVPMDRSRDAAVSRGGVRVPEAAEAAEERHR
jgi:CIC family chloride channel protein